MEENKINIDYEYYYEYDKPKDRTRKRLLEMIECGMEEVGLSHFGYPNVMSGLYIEMVWSYSDKMFEEYMKWAKELINNHKNKYGYN